MNEDLQDKGQDPVQDPAEDVAVEEPKRKPRPVKHPPGLTEYSAKGDDLETMRQQLFKEATGKELYYQEYPEEDGSTTLYAYLRTEVLDLIYSLAYPVIKIVDDRATLKVKSNRAVTEFFVIIQTRRSGAFIGQHGQTLDALETLIAHTVSRLFPRWVAVYIDVDKYRQKRQAYLEGLIKKVVREIERDHRERPMKGLLPKERKFVHQYFAEHPYLTTESRGRGQTRTLFIVPREDIQEV
jgi:predicted RNA-binding protein Jag